MNFMKINIKFDARGILGMASNGPNTNRSQFFIIYDKQPSLDLKYTAFGKVIDGFDTLEELENTKVDSKYRPVVEHRIRNITIYANPIADAHAAEER
uniref:Peptidyl-prolyl cis-trans isomerase n=2 Tax=Meloidogyne TaxID=189290 RepID=A0A915P2I2_9BILA